MINDTSIFKKATTALLVMIFVVAPFGEARKAEALVLVPVTAPIAEVTLAGMAAVQAEQSLVDQVLSGIAWAAAKAVIDAMTQSLVTWINSGFEGSPGFATNINRNLRQLGDGVAAGLLNELINNSQITSPWLQQIGGTVAAGYLLYTSRDRLASRLEYTLDRHLTNPESWIRGDFRQGGFDAWMSATFRCGNDRYCSEFAAQEELINRINSELQSRLNELSYGRGILCWKNCPDASQDDGVDTDFGGASLSDEDRSNNCTIQTPGTLIESQLATHVSSGVRRLEIADDIDEIVSALASQLVSQVMGGTGLLGASQPSSGSGRSFLEQSASQAAAADAARISAGLKTRLTNDRSATVEYQADWRAIKDAADAAAAICTNEGASANQASIAEIAAARAQADAAITEATEALTEIDRIVALIDSLQGLSSAQQTSVTLQITEAHSALVASGKIPDRSERQSAQTESTDTPGATPLPLITRMNEIAGNECE